MLKLKNKEVDVEEFGLEYVKHAALVKHQYRRNKLQYARVVAYNALAQRFGVSAWQARSLELLFRSYVRDKMQRLVRDGLRHLAELPEELSWLALVEDNFHLLPQLLQESPAEGQQRAPHELVTWALSTQVLLRGSLADGAMFQAARRAYGLAATCCDLEATWERGRRLAMEGLARSCRSGDAPAEALPAWLQRVADVVLLHSDLEAHRLLPQEGEQRREEAEALCALWQQVLRHRVEERAPPRSGVRALRWSRAHGDYCRAGRSASLVVLQRRWHELKLRARYKLLNYWRTTSHCHADADTTVPACSDPPREIHISILKRYPQIVTSPLPSWRQLVDGGLVVTNPVDDDDVNMKNDNDNSATTRKRTAELESTRSRDGRGPPESESSKPEPEPGERLHIRDTYSSNVPCVVKQERDVTHALDFHSILKNIKTEVDDATENHPYNETERDEYSVKQEAQFDHREPTTNGTNAHKVEVDVRVKQEPVERKSRCPIVFSDEEFDSDGESGDDGEDSMDKKLLWQPYVKLAQLDLAPLRDQSPPEHGHVEAQPMVKVEVEVEEAQYGLEENVKVERGGPSHMEEAVHYDHDDERQYVMRRGRGRGRGPGRAARVSKAQQSLALPLNNKLYILKRLQYAPQLKLQDIMTPAATKAMKFPDGTPKEPETLTLRQLNLLLNELTDVAMVNHLLRRTAGPCCAARKHMDISAARQRMGLPPLPRHTHGAGAACACCCGDTSPRRAALDADMRALASDCAAMAATAAPQLAHRH